MLTCIRTRACACVHILRVYVLVQIHFFQPIAIELIVITLEDTVVVGAVVVPHASAAHAPEPEANSTTTASPRRPP